MTMQAEMMEYEAKSKWERLTDRLRDSRRFYWLWPTSWRWTIGLILVADIIGVAVFVWTVITL